LPRANNGLESGTGTKFSGGLASRACRNVIIQVCPGAIDPYMLPGQ
jgi:hypothetical protein